MTLICYGALFRIIIIIFIRPIIIMGSSISDIHWSNVNLHWSTDSERYTEVELFVLY